MVDYAVWIAEQKRAAIARGGKPLRNLPGPDEDDYPRATNRQRGEIVNPITGEIVTGCLTVSKFSAQIGVTSPALTDMLETTGAIVRVLRADHVPMICDPYRTKPRYYHAPAVTRQGVGDGLVIPITVKHGGKRVPCILITREGQRLVKEMMGDTAASTIAKAGKVAEKRQTIGRLLAAGHSQAAIVRETGLPKQTVSRIVKTMPTSWDDLSHSEEIHL